MGLPIFLQGVFFCVLTFQTIKKGSEQEGFVKKPDGLEIFVSSLIVKKMNYSLTRKSGLPPEMRENFFFIEFY